MLKMSAQFSQDAVIDELVKKILTRSRDGIKKFGRTIEAADDRDWLMESSEELMDTCVYLMKELREERKKKKCLCRGRVAPGVPAHRSRTGNAVTTSCPCADCL